MKAILKSPIEERVNLRERKNRLLGLKLTYEEDGQLDARSKQLLKEVEQLIWELGDFRLKNPQFSEVVMGWEVELLDSFPGANPDGHK